MWRRLIQSQSRRALALLGVWLVFGIAGCAPLFYKVLGRDLDSAIVMAKAHGNGNEVRCFEAMRKVVAKLDEIEDLNADGVISLIYKNWLVKFYETEHRRSVALFCAPMLHSMGMHLLLR